jgi:hypothetical protein
MAETAERMRNDYNGVLIGAILLPVLLLFIYLGKVEMGRAVFLGLGAILFAVRIRWDLRRHFWFWAVIALVLALHIPLFFIARWPHGWFPWIVWLPIPAADCFIILGILRFVEKFIMRVRDPQAEITPVKST